MPGKPQPPAKKGAGRLPDFRVLSPSPHQRNYKGNSYWANIGAAWQDGDKITVYLNALPLGDKIFLFKQPPEEPKEDLPVIQINPNYIPPIEGDDPPWPDDTHAPPKIPPIEEP